jgi:hypothetical protein
MPRLTHRATWADTAYEVLRERDRPMHYVPLSVEVLRRVSKEDPKRRWGKTPQYTLASLLRKGSRFRLRSPGVWELAG